MKATDEQILDMIARYVSEHGYSPSMRDVAEMAGLKSTSSIHRRLRLLRDAGKLTFDDRISRSIVLRSQDA